MAGIRGLARVALFRTARVFSGRLDAMSAEEIKQAVAKRYGKVAVKPWRRRLGFPVGRAFAQSVGYPDDILDKIPAGFSECFTGAGNPQAHVDVREGETLLDMGCGAGLDLYFYSTKTGQNGRVCGLDISPEMLAKARANLIAAGVENFELLCAASDNIPLPDCSMDIVTANGIFNLSPDKDAVMAEFYRVLKPGGRTVFAEIVLKEQLDPGVRKYLDDWFRCVGGALLEDDFIGRMNKRGFIETRVLWSGRNKRTGHRAAVSAVIRAEKAA